MCGGVFLLYSWLALRRKNTDMECAYHISPGCYASKVLKQTKKGKLVRKNENEEGEWQGNEE